MPDGFTIEDLRLVRVIAEAGTLTTAARRLHVDHSTAFRRLGALERRLGVDLFHRSRDGYTPTLAGEAAVAVAARVLEEVMVLEHRIAGQDMRPSGVVRLTTTDTLVELVTPILACLRRDHPEVVVDLVVGNEFLALTRRDADVALRPATDAPETVVGRRLAMVATAPYAAPGHLSAPATDLEDRDWLGFDDSLRHLRSARWLAAHVPAERIVLRATSLIALREAARAGLGVALLPCYLGDPDPDLGRVAPPVPGTEVPLWLLVHPNLRRVARVRAVLDTMAAELAARRELLEGRSADRALQPPRRLTPGLI